MPASSNHPNSNLILSIRYSPIKTNKFENLLGELKDLQFHTEEGDLEVGTIFIPPKGCILHITSQDLSSETKTKTLQERITRFYHKFPWGVLIVEGFHRWGEKSTHKFQSIITDLFLTQITNASPIFLPTRNVHDSAEVIVRIAKREQIEDLPPALSRTNANTVLLADAQVYFIEGLLNCGHKKAKILLEKFDSPHKILRILQDHPEQIAGLKGFGQKFIDRNQELLSRIFS